MSVVNGVLAGQRVSKLIVILYKVKVCKYCLVYYCMQLCVFLQIKIEKKIKSF